MKKRLFTLLVLVAAIPVLHAQDPRERNYYYEILTPSHEPKPLVESGRDTRVTEPLDRGLVAVPTADGRLHLSWRLLDSDPADAGFNVYATIGNRTRKLNGKPLRTTTDFFCVPAKGAVGYRVALVGGKGKELSRSEALTVDAATLKPYRAIPLPEGVQPGKLAVADLDGDGTYDYILRTPTRGTDPGTKGITDGLTYKIQAYLADGTFLWSYDLGQGIEPGVWYSPFVAYDFDGDGRAEVALKTAGDDVKRDAGGRVGWGEEYITVLDGMTGTVIARADWPERNDRYGNLNRQNRNQMGVAYLDGKNPYILACRGTYKLMVVDAWQLKDGTLTRAWRWDGDEENPVVRSMGAHSLVCGDVDGDGRDEVLLGSCMLDDNGTLLWSTGLGHPDKIYLTDIDPARPGMEVYACLEPWHDNGRGVSMVDARTGEQLWGIGHKTYHVGSGMVADYDPAIPGLECFAGEDSKGGSRDRYLLSASGQYLSLNDGVPPTGDWAWWDGDLLRETFGREERADASPMEWWNRWTQTVIKWPAVGSKAEPVKVDGGIDGSILLVGDLCGDWREEIVTAAAGELRIYSTPLPARDRRVTLMQDALYRNYVAVRSMGYPQPPVPSYYLGE